MDSVKDSLITSLIFILFVVCLMFGIALVLEGIFFTNIVIIFLGIYFLVWAIFFIIILKKQSQGGVKDE